MLAPSLHSKEKRRLQIVESFGILDTPEEPIFDDLTAFAANYFGVECCLITFLDLERQWFKSHYGTEFSETPRNISFCGHTILEKEGSMVVNDASKDVRFADNPLLTGDLGLQFYASHVIQGDYELPLGSFCIIDSAARSFSEKEMNDLKYFSSLCLELMESRKIGLQHKKDHLESVHRNEEKALAIKWLNIISEDINLKSRSLVLDLIEDASDSKEFIPGLEKLLEHIDSESIELDDLKSLLKSDEHQLHEQILAAELIHDTLAIHQLNIKLSSNIEDVSLTGSFEQLAVAFNSMAEFMTSDHTSESIEVSSLISDNTLVVIFKKEKKDKFSLNYSLANQAKHFVDGNLTKINSKLFLAKSLLKKNKGKIWSYGAENIGLSLFVSLPITHIKLKE